MSSYKSSKKNFKKKERVLWKNMTLIKACYLKLFYTKNIFIENESNMLCQNALSFHEK